MEELLFSSITWLVLIGCAGLLRLYGQRKKMHDYYTSRCPPPTVEKDDIVFTGEQLGLSVGDLHNILIKRFHYYSCLNATLQNRFISRLRIFMLKKNFIIKDNKGVREMPVLVSAAAVQLCFGLKKYRMSFYKYIRIYPQEYFSEYEFFKVLAGNVQNNVITVAWNHVLSSYQYPADGYNTPLHEMSHALYMQKMVIDEQYAQNFHLRYQHLLNEFRMAHRAETQKEKDHYSEYAETNLQEFWAESVELFFERPYELLAGYPNVFEAMTLLLNQDPRNSSNPVIKHDISFQQRYKKILNLISTTPAFRSIKTLDQ